MNTIALPNRTHLKEKGGVCLNPLTPDCAERMLTFAQDPEIRMNLGIRVEPTLERTREWITRVLASDDTKVFTVWLDGEHVGNVVFDQRDKYLSTTRFSIYVIHRGRGIGAEATRQGLAVIFPTWNLEKVWLTVHAENERAIACYRKVGFQQEGVHRGEFLLDGRRIDAIYMGILHSEI